MVVYHCSGRSALVATISVDSSVDLHSLFFFGTDQLFYSLQIKRAKPSQNVQKNNTIPNGNCKKAFRGPYKKHLGGDSRRGRSGARIRGRPRRVESKKKIHQSSRVRSMVDVKVDTEEDMEVEVDVEEHVGNT